MAENGGLSELQTYAIERPLKLGPRARDLKQNLVRTLVAARNAKKLQTSHDSIAQQVKLLDESKMAEEVPEVYHDLKKEKQHQGAFCIHGCPKNFGRDPDAPRFLRDDGAWFDFSIVVRESPEGLLLLAYDYEIRFAPTRAGVIPAIGTAFLRFDLNLPGQDNQHRDLRCHMHPGSDDILIPAPLMTPQEALWLFIHGFRPSPTREPRTAPQRDVGAPSERKSRMPTAFELAWLTTTAAKWTTKPTTS
ncbi:MAG: hypothetical protein H0T76_12015 [Nannocystis sp.]|nr:hypothetical protein [Nannocystis sp.]MBA3547203.1 hypothetical protein [Nannocystis sp.]